MSNINIEGKNLKDIDQSNFQSVGPYTDRDEIKEPWQGRNKESGSQDTDLRFKLGTYTENNRNYWEIQTVNPITRKSQFQSEDLKTARAKRENELVISDEVNWSVDTFPFTINENNETTPLYFYYDKGLHPREYNNAVNGKVNLRIELRESGRDVDGNIDNFLLREPYRPFYLGLDLNSYGTTASGLLLGAGAFNFGDRVTIEAIPSDDSYFERWTNRDDNQTLSTDLIYSLTMPRADFEVVGNIRLNPMIRMMSTVNGAESEEAGRVWFGILDEYPSEGMILENTLAVARYIHNFYSDEPIDDVIPDEGTTDLSTETTRGHDDVFILLESEYDEQGSDDGYDVYTYTWGPNIQDLEAYPDLPQFSLSIPDTIYEQNIYRPEKIIKLYAEPSGPQFSFINYTYLNENGDIQEIPNPYTGDSSDAELILAGQYTVGEIPTLLNYTGPKGVHTILPTPEYPGGVLQIYANYAVAFYRVRSYNRWKNSNEQNLAYRLRYGYGAVTLNEQEVPTTLEYMLGENLIVSAEPAQNGYDLGEFFFWPGAGATLEFDENITNTIIGDDSRFFVSDQFTPDSDQVQQIIFNEDDITYIGHKFKQLGTYIRITQADNSANFTIDVEPNNSDILRENQGINETEINAPMYQIGGDELTWFFGVNPNGAELPVIQNITYWDDNTNQLTTTNNPSEIGITLDQQGNNQLGSPEPNQVVLHYPTPNSNESNNYYKYLDIKLFSEIILQPFLGIFELTFQNNNDSYGTVSFLQETDDILQTTYIGSYGGNIETPTYAHTLDEWLADNYTPSALDVDLNDNDAQLTSLTVNLHPTFNSKLEQILGASQFSDWAITGRNFAVLNNMDSYLNRQITSNNSLSITPEPNNNSSINDDIEEVLEYINQNAGAPRLPLRVNAIFGLFRTIQIQNIVPTRWKINWDQSTYEENSNLTNADNWIDNTIVDTIPSSADNQAGTVIVPSGFFNGTRQLKIWMSAPPTLAVDGPDISTSGGASVDLSTEEIDSNNYYVYITNTNNSFTLTLDWFSEDGP